MATPVSVFPNSSAARLPGRWESWYRVLKIDNASVRAGHPPVVTLTTWHVAKSEVLANKHAFDSCWVDVWHCAAMQKHARLIAISGDWSKGRLQSAQVRRIVRWKLWECELCDPVASGAWTRLPQIASWPVPNGKGPYCAKAI